MSTKKQRRPPGLILYSLFWIGGVWIVIAFLGTIGTLIPNFVRDYSQYGAGAAISKLLGELIVYAIGVFCILEIVDANKIQRELGRRDEER